MELFLPIFFSLKDKRVLIVGGGNVALQKLKILLQFTRKIVVISKNIDTKIPELGVRCKKRKFKKSDLKGIDLLYICTDKKETNKKIKRLATKNRVLANTVDDKTNSDFISPAFFFYDNMTVAVSSNGEDVLKSVRWRDEIREIVKNGGIN